MSTRELTRAGVLALVREQYSGTVAERFGPTLRSASPVRMACTCITRHVPVLVSEAADGGLEIRQRDRAVRWTEIPTPRAEATPVPRGPRPAR